MGKTALITGITGQDGSYLAELLLNKGYVVHGIKRRSSSFNTSRIDDVLPDWHEREARLFLHFADLSDSTSLVRLLYRLQPDEIYHLGAQSHVLVSFEIPEYTGDVTALGTVRLLEAIRETGHQDQVLSSLEQRDVRQSGRNSAAGNHAVSALQSLRLFQALCLLDDCQLPGRLWPFRV